MGVPIIGFIIFDLIFLGSIVAIDITMKSLGRKPYRLLSLSRFMFFRDKYENEYINPNNEKGLISKPAFWLQIANYILVTAFIITMVFYEQPICRMVALGIIGVVLIMMIATITIAGMQKRQAKK